MRYWDDEEVFHDGDAYFSRVLAAVGHAKRSVDWETYIFDRDRQGERVLAALASAAARGVRVRLLIDGAGSSGWNYRDLERARRLGIQVRIYHPLPWQVRPLRLLGELASWKPWLSRLGQMNRRNHRKTCIIDSHAAFSGGMNVSEHHLREWRGAGAWHDIAVRVVGDSVQALETAFYLAWRESGASRPRSARRWLRRAQSKPIPAGVRLNSNRFQRQQINEERIQRIQQASERVWITTPYLVPQLRLILALRETAARGVDVRLLTPSRSDVFFMRWINRAFHPVLLHAGVRIHEYRSAFLHGKLNIVDDWVVVGSSNLNHRSLLHDLEVGIVLSNPQTLKDLELRFQNDLQASQEIRSHHLRGWRWGQVLLGRLLLVFRRWI